MQVRPVLTLFVRSWRPAANARGVVVIVPGFNSHSGYCGWTAEQLVAADFAVYQDKTLKLTDTFTISQ